MITRHNSVRPTILPTMVPAVGTSPRGSSLALRAIGRLRRHSRHMRKTAVASATVRMGPAKLVAASHADTLAQYLSTNVSWCTKAITYRLHSPQAIAIRPPIKAAGRMNHDRRRTHLLGLSTLGLAARRIA